MIVCMCHGVRCSAVKAAVRAGALTVDAVGEACGAGTDCGGCRALIEDMIEDVAETDSQGRTHLRVAQSAA